MNDNSNESPTSPEGPRQIYCPPRVRIATFKGGAGGNALTDLYFRINTPDARVRGKFSIMAVPMPGTRDLPAQILSGRNLSIWPYAVEDDQVIGGRGTPVSDVIPGVTAASRQNLPLHGALGGFSREFVTISDGIECLVRVPIQAPAGKPGVLVVQARYQPKDSVGFIPWGQWDEIRSRCDIHLLTPELVVP